MGTFIQANIDILLAMCGVVFLLGMFLWFMGTAMRKEGDARHQAILDREETKARTAFWRQHEVRPVQEPTDCLYPPIAEADYDPIEY